MPQILRAAGEWLPPSAIGRFDSCPVHWELDRLYWPESRKLAVSSKMRVPGQGRDGGHYIVRA
jgi:hypothetical protein